MAREKNKKDSFYFTNFCEAAEVSRDTATLLCDVLKNFDPATIEEKKEAIHELENCGDAKKHEMIRELVRAFITPIEREDILSLSQNIDEVTDALDDIAIHIYVNAVDSIRPEALEFAELLVRACEAMCEMLKELENFKKSNTLADGIRRINDIEEEGDRIYVTALRRLATEEKDPMAVLAWRELFGYFEKCCDAVEHVSDIVEAIVIANS